MLKKALFCSVGIFLLVIVLLLAKCFYFVTERQIAITIDDLPMVMADNEFTRDRITDLKNSLIKYKAPVTGFIIADRITPEFSPQLEVLLRNGWAMGSHTYSHPNLNKTSAQFFIDDLIRADKILTPFMTAPKYFRYPYLAQGKWQKKTAVHDYLRQQHYIIAPVTIDSRDFIFNLRLAALHNDPNHPEFAALKKEYLHFVWHQTLKRERQDKWLGWSLHSKKQILLLHANLLNTYLLDSLLQMYQSHGYRFITVDAALT